MTMRFQILALTSVLFTSCLSHAPDEKEDGKTTTPTTVATAIDEDIQRKKIDELMDGWHKAAAIADEKTFFGAMSDDAIYLGTDKTERWTKEEFYGFAKPYFDRGKAWSFTASDRYILFSENSKTAWLDEQLDTWMGPCRGSAVLQLKAGGWKIVHYDLSYMVDNDIMDSVIELTKSAPPRKKSQ